MSESENPDSGSLLDLDNGDGGHGHDADGSGQVAAASETADGLFTLDEMCHILQLQALLGQFAHPKVRADFLNNKFNWTINPNVLPRIDDLRCLLFPRWNGASQLDGSSLQREAQAAHHLKALNSKCKSLLVLPGEAPGASLSHEVWFTLLNNIATDKYWAIVQAEARCTHIIAPESLSSGAGSVVTSRRQHPRSSRNIKVKNESQRSSSSSSSLDADASLTSDSDCSEGRASCHHYRRDKRDVVTPPVFELDGKMELKAYLDIYESYFEAKFNGSEYDKTQELERFLKDQLLTVYKIRGGRKLKYGQMKKELLGWFKKQKIRGKSFWQDKLAEARPEENETLDMYGLRLVELAHLAYPKSATEREKKLKRHFMETIVINIAEKVKDADRMMRATKVRKGLSFVEMSAMVRELQKEEGKRVTWVKQNAAMSGENSRSSYAAVQQPVEKMEHSEPHRTVVISRSNRSASQASRTSSRSSGKTCYYCNKPGHIKKECWRASKLCLICGKDHKMVDCIKYNPNFKKGREDRKAVAEREVLNDQALLRRGRQQGK